MAERYRAISNGTLSNPYRWVKKGETVNRSQIDLTDDALAKSSWLLPIEAADAKLNNKPLPITPYVGQDGRNVRPREAGFVPPAPSSTGYTQQMSEVQKLEKQIDDKAAADKAAAGQTTINNPTTAPAQTSTVLTPVNTVAGAGAQNSGDGTSPANKDVL
jgi:hypothetical protein